MHMRIKFAFVFLSQIYHALINSSRMILFLYVLLSVPHQRHCVFVVPNNFYIFPSEKHIRSILTKKGATLNYDASPFYLI